MADLFRTIINFIAVIAIPLMIAVFLGWGFIKKVKVYEAFVEGAKDGFQTAVKIIPYLVAMLFAIGIFRASGAMDILETFVAPITNLIGMPPEALPMAFMRPLSGSDSFIGVLASTMYGSSETTFYVLAVYFGAVNISKTRHAVPVGLLADAAGMLGAVFICRMLFGL